MPLDGTITLVSKQDLADREKVLVDMVGPSSYVNGGEPVTAGLFPFRVGNKLEQISGYADDGEAGQVQFDAAGSTLKFLTPAGVEEIDTADLSANTYRLAVLGR